MDDIATHPDVMELTVALTQAQSELYEAVYGNEPFIDAEEVLKAAQECRSTDNARNRLIAQMVMDSQR